MGSEKKLCSNPESRILYRTYSSETLLMEGVLWGSTEWNEKKKFSFSLLMPLMGRLFASLVYLTSN